MEPLAGIDLFNLDNSTLALIDCVDGVNAKPPAVNEPRYDQLSHYLPSIGQSAPVRDAEDQ
jgi:hypothetical protein